MSKVLTITTPGASLSQQKMPGHWVLARLGKRVLRPGGMELTRRMIAALTIVSADDVIEFAPGLGITAQLALKRRPALTLRLECQLPDRRSDLCRKSVWKYAAARSMQPVWR